MLTVVAANMQLLMKLFTVMMIILMMILMMTLAHCIPTLHTKGYGQCAFSHSAPTLWNIFSKAIRNSESALSFKSALKTYLF